MILRHGLIATADPLRDLVREMAELGHHAESARTPAGGGSSDPEYPALVRFASKMAGQYADDARNRGRYLAAAGLGEIAGLPLSDAEQDARARPHDDPCPRCGRRQWTDPGNQTTCQACGFYAPEGVPATAPCWVCEREDRESEALYTGTGEEGQPLYTCGRCGTTFTPEGEPA